MAGDARELVAIPAASPGRRASRSPTVGTLRATPTVFTIANYRRFVGGQLLSLIGSWTETIAQGLLILSLTHSGLTLGLVTATRYLPVLFATPYAGLIVDRQNKRRLMMLTSTLLAGVSVIVGISVLARTIAIWQVFVAAALFGIVTAVDNPARMALIPELVGTDMTRRAVTTNSIFANVGRAVGPAVAAVTIHAFGLGWCFLFNALSFGMVLIALARLDMRTLHPSTAVRRGDGQLREGLKVARGNRDIAGPLAMMVFVGTLTYEFEVSLPIFAEQTIHGGLDGYSWLTSAFGAGTIVAGLVLMRWPQTGLPRLVVASAGYGVAMTVMAFSPTLQAAIAAAVLVGACSIAFLTTGNGTIQLAAAPEIRGRVTGLWTTAFVGSTPIGAVIIGSVAHSLGGRAALGIGAAGCLAAVLIGLLILRHVRPVQFAPHAQITGDHERLSITRH
jgi:MFS family permease